jgi:PAS domain S-box-containing protein
VRPEAAAAVAGASAGAARDGGVRGLEGAERARQAGIVTAAHAAVSRRDDAVPAPSALPGVLADVPVAVLVIDRKSSAVTFANPAAVELAGNVHLPVDVDTWGAKAGLTDLNGRPLASTSGPLSVVASGRPVSGEAVRLAPGRSSDARRAEDDDGSNDQVLWVTGFPLSHTTSAEQLSLVVFLELDATSVGDRDTALQALRERAVIATDITFTISDPRREDDPLVWVNPSFTRMTGYSYDEAVGSNCRFLQGPATDPAAVDELRAALRERRQVTTTLLNYRKDGTAFWNQLSVSPVFDGEGELVSFVGVQTDVTERVRVERERAAAFAAEQSARQEAENARLVAERARADAERARTDAERARWGAERAQARLALMAETTTTLSATLEMRELLDRLAALCVPLLADWAYITLVDEHGVVRDSAYRHRDEGHDDDLERFTSLHVMHLPPTSPSRRSMATAQPVLLPDITDEVLEAAVTSAGAREAFRRLGGVSVLTVPMVARRRTLGALALVSTSAERTFDQDDVDMVADLARRAALVMDNVRLYQQEHTVADTLQRSLLPEIPRIEGIEAAAHYVSASTAADVGGDFYDLLQLPDGSIAIVVGDVVGHDVAAAATMGHLRGLIRACLWEADDPDPGAVLGKVDRLVQGLEVASMATLVYARAVPPREDDLLWRLEVGNAGHPPVLLRGPEGEVRLLDGATGLLVGVDASSTRTTRVVELPAGSTLLAYTDGLIERPGLDLDSGIAELAQRLAAAPVSASPAELCAAAVSGTLDRRDDVALLAVRFC